MSRINSLFIAIILIIGPQLKSFAQNHPSSFADLAKIGGPPTALKALTGEFTPPGITVFASLNKALLLLYIII